MLGNTKFNPSLIEEKIYEMMEGYMIGMDTYSEGLVSAVIDFFAIDNSDIELNLGCSEWLDCSGGVCYVSWIEGGHLYTISFDYKKEGFYNE